MSNEQSSLYNKFSKLLEKPESNDGSENFITLFFDALDEDQTDPEVQRLAVESTGVLSRQYPEYTEMIFNEMGDHKNPVIRSEMINYLHILIDWDSVEGWSLIEDMLCHENDPNVLERLYFKLFHIDPKDPGLLQTAMEKDDINNTMCAASALRHIAFVFDKYTQYIPHVFESFLSHGDEIVRDKAASELSHLSTSYDAYKNEIAQKVIGHVLTYTEDQNALDLVDQINSYEDDSFEILVEKSRDTDFYVRNNVAKQLPSLAFRVISEDDQNKFTDILYNLIITDKSPAREEAKKQILFSLEHQDPEVSVIVVEALFDCYRRQGPNEGQDILWDVLLLTKEMIESKDPRCLENVQQILFYVFSGEYQQEDPKKNKHKHIKCMFAPLLTELAYKQPEMAYEVIDNICEDDVFLALHGVRILRENQYSGLEQIFIPESRLSANWHLAALGSITSSMPTELDQPWYGDWLKRRFGGTGTFKFKPDS